MSDDGCVAFLQWALPRLGMRWAGFRKVRGQVCKRIGRRVAELGLEGLDAYRRRLEADPEEWRVLDSFCRVTISRFLRDRGVFELLAQRALPALAERAGAAGVVRAWSAGCASGEEPYSLALLWRFRVEDRYPGVGLQVVATDADAALLGRARAGRYPPSSLKELPEVWVEAAFHRDGDELVLRPGFREGVELRRQDLRQRMPAGPFQLVLCRNLVFTYFEPEIQARLLRRILERLVPGGFLVLGPHEKLPPGSWPLERAAAGSPVFRATAPGLRPDPPE